MSGCKAKPGVVGLKIGASSPAVCWTATTGTLAAVAASMTAAIFWTESVGAGY